MPTGDGADEPLKVHVQRWIRKAVPRGVLTDHAKDRRLCSPRVVEIGDPVGETGAKMQERHGRAVEHPRVAVRGARADPLKEPEYRLDAGHPVHRHDNRNFRGPRVGKADFDPAGRRGPYKRFRPIHNP